MKIGWTFKILITTLLVASTSMVGCGRKNNANPTAANGFGLDAFGNPIIPGGGAGYIGAGQWEGTLTVQNPSIYREMLLQQGFCGGYMCNYVSNWMFMNINLSAQWLPGPASFSIRSYSNGFWSGGRYLRADAYAQGNTGFQLIYNAFPYGGGFFGFPNMQPGIGAPNAQNTAIQVIATFVDNTRQLLNTQVLYRGTPVATGQLRGQMTSGGFCAGGGFNCMQPMNNNGQFGIQSQQNGLQPLQNQ